MSDIDFKTDLSRKAEIANTMLRDLISEQSEIEPRLKEAMAYTLNAPGKRIRAALVMWACELVCGKITDEAKVAAATLEMVHAYSLVHDDLPAMDDDDMRRGQPTVHKKFDEATAILTGDALLTIAFEILATKVSDSNLAIKLVGVLATVAGPSGMVAGQMADLMSENTGGNLELLEYIHHNKTAMMFSGAATMGALCGGPTKEQLHGLSNYGLKIGLGFQVADDILDVSATDEQLGKTAGKDIEQGKTTYPALLGLEKSKDIAKQLTTDAVEALSCFGNEADVLRELAVALLHRTK